jgi:hypothetical protein
MRWLLVLTFALVAACQSKKADDKPAKGPAPKLGEIERKRGEDACSQYVAALCRCAEKKPELADQCDMKKAKPEALALLLAVDDDPKASDDSRLRAQIEARKLISKCVMEHASLPGLGCHP